MLSIFVPPAKSLPRPTKGGRFGALRLVGQLGASSLLVAANLYVGGGRGVKARKRESRPGSLVSPPLGLEPGRSFTFTPCGSLLGFLIQDLLGGVDTSPTSA